jgi:hypothetical protein
MFHYVHPGLSQTYHNLFNLKRPHPQFLYFFETREQAIREYPLTITIIYLDGEERVMSATSLMNYREVARAVLRTMYPEWDMSIHRMIQILHEKKIGLFCMNENFLRILCLKEAQILLNDFIGSIEIVVRYTSGDPDNLRLLQQYGKQHKYDTRGIQAELREAIDAVIQHTEQCNDHAYEMDTDDRWFEMCQ